MRANRYLHIAIIFATLLFFLLGQTAAAGPPEKPGNPGLPGCLAKVSELNDMVANQQETINQQEARIEELEAMLENFAAVPQTGQTTIYGERDDGELQMGVQWPDPRFDDNGDGTVTDNLTGLIWLKNADCFGKRNWNEAIESSNNLANGQCGLSDGSSTGDWRLPNTRELFSLIDYDNYKPAIPSGHPFIIPQLPPWVYYWTSTTDPGYAGSAFIVEFDHGLVHGDTKNYTQHVWPVRGGN